MTNVQLSERVVGLAAGDTVAAASGPVVVDLSEVGFVSPSGLVSLAAACLEVRRRGQPLSVTAPESLHVDNYLIRVGFRDLLKTARCSLPPDFAERVIDQRPLPGRLLELQLITKAADKVGERLLDLGRSIRIPKETMQHAFVAWSETVDNAMLHSETEAALTVAQRYRDAGATRLEIGVADVGIGLRRSLKRHRPADDEEAIGLALQPGTSRFVDPHRGYGLQAAAGATRGRGTFEIRSGTASVTVGHAARRYAVDRAGVLVAIRLSVDD